VKDDSLSLFGFPVVVTDVVPEGEILFGSLPTLLEILEHGSLEAAIKATGKRWAKITNVSIDDE